MQASMYDTLEEVRTDIAARLTEAARDRRVPMHTPVVVTGDANARVMVLRDFDPARWTLRFHTDARAPKVAAIDANPRMTVIAYDQPGKVQLRLHASGRIEHEGPAVDAAWADSTNFARRCYLGEAPGATADRPLSGLPEHLEGVEPDDEEIRRARENFAILLVEVAEIDWFSLAHTGHRRALLTPTGGGRIAP